jgi:glycosyltransferase involved in cell wall biosynthesis
MESTYGCPCVTVLIPAKNAQDFISESLSSAIEQSHLAQIIVLVNDSSDSTEEIVMDFSMRHPIVQLIKLPAVGISGALNAGIRLVDTPFIARLDADDLMVPHRISKQVEFMSSHPHVAVLGSQLEYISTTGTHIGFSNYPTRTSWIKTYLSFGNPIAHPSVLIRASALSIDPYKSEFEGVEDLALWIDLAKGHELANLDEFLTKYRQHKNQVSISPRVKYQEVELRLSSNLFRDTNFLTRLAKSFLNRLKVVWILRKIRKFERL